MISHISYVVGAAVIGVGGAMVAAALVSAMYQEWQEAGGILAASAVSIVSGVIIWRGLGTRGEELTSKEGFAIVGISWFVIAAFGTLPYLFTGSIPNITNAYFETASGFTTTGSSVLADPSLLSHGILFWRSLTQWIGGMGIIVLGVAVLPMLGIGGVQLARAESPGPTPDRLTPRFRETAKRLWWVYIGLTVIETLLLWAGEMTLFQAINHAFTTMSTGGFGTESTSIGGFSAYTQWVIILFMFLAGASFALHYRALRRPKEYVEHPEFRLYAMLTIGAFIIIGGELIANLGLSSETVRDAAFTATSIITTTGFGTADFAQWVSGLQIFIIGLFFLGGMSGSTAGSVKTYRIAVLTQAANANLRRVIHPRGVFVTRFGKKAVPEHLVASIQSFFLFYMFLFMTGTFLMGFIDSNLTQTLDLVTAASSVASALGNIGPGLGDVGPSFNYLGISAPGKWLLACLMIAGRLELFPVLLLGTRDLWRR